MLNACALTKKMDELRCLISLNKPFFIFICETWFTDSITMHLVYVDDGVCIYYKSSLVVENLHLTNPCKDFDVIAIKEKKQIFILIYVPPNLSKDRHMFVLHFLVKTFDEYYNIYPYCIPFLCGDMNNLPTKRICNEINMKNVVCGATRKRACLLYTSPSPRDQA